jgi:hypothetical protein
MSKTIASRYIVGPLYDNFFFIFSPALSLLLGISIASFYSSNQSTRLNDESLISIAFGTFLMGHFIVGFFRTHGNPQIFSRYPYRFTIIPLILLIAMLTVNVFLFAAVIIASLWDEWHSGQQTFGFCRIYDGKINNNPNTGRKLDMAMNALIWFGPLLGGATLIEHMHSMNGDISRISTTFFSAVPAYAENNFSAISWLIVAFASAFTVYYIHFYYQQHKHGYIFSVQKITLLIVTAAVSVYAWGFNSFGEAYLIMNVFHYLQYYALVWHIEKNSFTSRLRLPSNRLGISVTFLIFTGGSLLIAYFLEMTKITDHTLLALFTLISMMHFWYDSFTFSVRKKEI